MFPGPVFSAELLAISRRKRSYAMRFFYGLVLLLLIWEYCFRSLPGRFDRPGETITINAMAELGFKILQTFAITQAVILIFLTPALVAGAIADERQRKTLDYLLASRLSSADIVLGKLAARLLQVGVFVTLGVPIQCLMTLFGGIPLELILMVYAGTVSSVFFLAAVSLATSIYAKRPRDAIFLVYILLIVWLFGPFWIAFVLPSGAGIWVQIYDWVRPINEWVGASSPLYVVTMGYVRSRARSVGLEATAWMIGLQLGCGLVLVAWSIARLRPVFRHAGESARWLPWASRRSRGKRLFPRPPCGDDAMLWKEKNVARISRGIKIVGLVIAAIVGVVLAYATFRLAVPAFEEAAQNGSETFGSFSGYQDRWSFNIYLRVVVMLIYILWALAVASTGATSITSEREADTWTSLIAAPLDGWEILRAKMVGAVWGTRWLGGVLMVFGLTGVAAGAVHPLGFLAVAVETLVFVWFAAALGTFISLRAKTSARALTATIGLILVANGGYLMCCIPFFPNARLVFAGITPVVEFASLLNYIECWNLFRGSDRTVFMFGDADMILTCVFSVFLYAVAALAITVLSVAGFDEEIDRPRQDSAPPDPSPVEGPAPGS